MKTPLPESIENQMKAYRADLAPLPDEFIAFHKNLAEIALKDLQENGEIEVIFTVMKYDGRCLDRMEELNVRGIVRNGPDKDETVVYLHWHPGNQEFFIKSPSGGSYPFRLRDK